MEHVAIIVDGTDAVVRDGTVGFPVGSIRAPRRPLAGLGIAIVTALVTMGAMGPRPTSTDAALAQACAPANPAPVADGPAALPTLTVTAGPVPWWLRPQVREWVDPATGRSMQAQPDRPHRVAHGAHWTP